MKIERNSLIVKRINELRMEIGESGYAFTDPVAWQGRNIRMPFSRLYLVKTGGGWLRSGEQTITMQAGYAYFIPAGLLFDHGCDGPMEKLYFHVHLTKPDGYDLTEGISQFGICKIEEAWLDRMIACYYADDWLETVVLDAGIRHILVKMLQPFSKQLAAIPHYSPLVETAMRYAQEHLSAGIRTSEVATALAVSESKLMHQFRQERGQTLRQYIEDMVFAAALRQLLESDRTLDEICDALGFSDPYYFSRRFRQRYGEPPSVYREKASS
jgi:AraC-like DNA-binding protein